MRTFFSLDVSLGVDGGVSGAAVGGSLSAGLGVEGGVPGACGEGLAAAAAVSLLDTVCN